MAINRLIDNEFSPEYLKANVIAHIEIYKENNSELRRKDPNDPLTRKILQDQMKALENIICMIKYIQFWENFYVIQEIKQKDELLKDMDRMEKVAREMFNESLRQANLISKKSGENAEKTLLVVLEQQKQSLNNSISKLEEEKKLMREQLSAVESKTEKIINTASDDWQARHKSAVENYINEYGKASETFLEKMKDPKFKEFQDGVNDFKKLENNYNSNKNKFDDNIALALDKIEALKHEKYKIEIQQARIQELQEQLNNPEFEGNKREIENNIVRLTRALENQPDSALENINNQLNAAREEKENLESSPDKIALDKMKAELESKSEFNEDCYLAKDMNGKVIEVNDLKEALMQARNDIKTLVKSDVNKVLMDVVDQFQKEGVTLDKKLQQISEVTANKQNFLAQIKFLNSNAILGEANLNANSDKRDSNEFLKVIKEKCKLGNIINESQASILGKPQDQAAIKSILGAKYEVHKTHAELKGKMADVDSQLEYKKVELKHLEEQLIKLNNKEEKTESPKLRF